MTAPIHGNYHDYYSKRAYTAQEPRLALLPDGLLHGKRVLDIGCNQGWVTCEIAQSYGASTVVGVDLDATLISQAWKRRRLVWSLQQPPTSEPSVAKDEQERPSKRRKRTPSPSPPPALDPNYFPSAFQHELGPLPLPEEGDHQDREMFPLNVTFRTADWARDGIREDAEGWDVIVCFSVTKWIHLHGGDAGLKAFFRRIFDTLRPGGTLVLEPQEWSSYSKAWRMHPTLKETAAGLELRPDGFGDVLVKMGFIATAHLGSSGQAGFDRPIDLYTKPT